MRVEVSDPKLVEDLLESLRNAQCDVVRTDASIIEVLRGMGLDGLEKNEAAKDELRAKGLLQD